MSDEPAATMEIAVLRAKLCELLAVKAGLKTDSYFTVGMFSALDMLMHQPIESILAKLPLSDAIKDAILHHRGLPGSALACALAIENAEWSEIEFRTLDQEDMLEVYREAVQWTNKIIRSL